VNNQLVDTTAAKLFVPQQFDHQWRGGSIGYKAVKVPQGAEGGDFRRLDVLKISFFVKFGPHEQPTVIMHITVGNI